MQRIMVIGVSAGAGKTTFARHLGELLDLPVYHLDAYFWKPGWVESSKEQFREVQNEMVKEPRWIIEGNYSSTFDIRLPACDTLIQLELPLGLCVWRVITRRFQYRNKKRPDMAAGCPEKLDRAFLRFILTTYRDRKKSQRELVKKFSQHYPEKSVYALRSRKEIDRFIAGIDK